VGTLVPVIGLVQVGETARADRYTYVPQIGLLVAIVWLAAGWVEGRPVARKAAAFAAAAAVIVLMGLGMRQVSFWRNTVTLFTHTVEVSPMSANARFNLGAGFALTGRPELAEPQFRIAAELNPAGPGILQNWGASLIEVGKPGEAVEVLRRLIEIQPDRPEHHYQLALAYYHQGQLAEAIFRAKQALRINPEYGRATELITKCRESILPEVPIE
jgi:tetratricopeptide (TPR) repeat protein